MGHFIRCLNRSTHVTDMLKNLNGDDEIERLITIVDYFILHSHE